MKKSILFLGLLFLVSCGETQISSEVPSSVTSSETTSLSDDEKIKSFINSMQQMNDVVNKTSTISNTYNNLSSNSTYTSTLYKDNILIDEGKSSYESSSAFDFQIQTYKTSISVVKVWYYGENNKENYATSVSLKSYTSEDLNELFSLNKNKYFYSMLNSILNDSDYTEGNTEHIFNRTITLEENENIVLDCYYEYQTTVTEDDSSQIEVMNYSCRLTFNDNKLISSYEKIVGARYIDEYQYAYASSENTIDYQYGELTEFTGKLIDPDTLNN